MFFFKLKTAYEMRISDWSSDVCSSDLHHRKALGVVDRGIVADFLQREAVVRVLRVRQDQAGRARPTLGALVEQQAMGRPLVVDIVLQAVRVLCRILEGEIGRASCRERVCEYV